MKITDEEIEKDLKACEKAWPDSVDYDDDQSHFCQVCYVFPSLEPDYVEDFCDAPICNYCLLDFAEEARKRWPLYINGLKELRKENEAIYKLLKGFMGFR